ncbi:hypothetical protein D3858_01490 [Streptococcus mutans]|nr:hypothetical protein [Streptococcus mutans]
MLGFNDVIVHFASPLNRLVSCHSFLNTSHYSETSLSQLTLFLNSFLIFALKPLDQKNDMLY